ncbi:MAG: hypothetical protein JNM76_01170 [Betaproteobacteria bacterium]|nr:hypothetical protein [Betaproteobacteria bacterium]
MQLDIQVPASIRHAALIVHALPEAERGWIMGVLADHERQLLSPLLMELVQLGIPADTTLVGSVIAADHRSSSAPIPHSSADDPGETQLLRSERYALDGTLIKVLARELSGEPTEMIALLLAADDWPWKTELLKKLPATVRVNVEAALGMVAEAGKLARIEAREIMLSRVQHVRDQSGQRPPRGASWRGLMQKGYARIRRVASDYR